MSIITTITKIERIHQLILKKRTGTPDCLANKLGVSRSHVYKIIKELKVMGAPIIYCRTTASFKYLMPVEFIIGFEQLTTSKVGHASNIKDISGTDTSLKKDENKIHAMEGIMYSIKSPSILVQTNLNREIN